MTGGELARAWDDAADGYERYFVPRFAPWVDAAVGVLTRARLPEGPILVPCCGTFPELPALVGAYPEREIVGIDLSPGMIALARERAAQWPNVRAVVGDAATLDPRWHGACAGVVSVFGLQQLPDPAAALDNWVGALRPGGLLSVMFWPPEVEQDGPFALMRRVLNRHRPPGDDSWADRLGDTEPVSFPMSHADAAAVWRAMAESGPARAFANARGEEFMRAVEREFLELAPIGPWHHRPTASLKVVRKPPAMNGVMNGPA
ncbi:class I SAM-dependent methyltransferase [Allorhizocola rhizosphaerae]|uniref:class I SAM-dependent methyltransferase n=1 Tax=Allorhizocola rhizosphaerae TaxID=1872709 RepID=UPI000E3CC970|nr:class I SAM-dependent methyltransferase [Allorhizocola rhizosphaerae]